MRFSRLRLSTFSPMGMRATIEGNAVPAPTPLRNWEWQTRSLLLHHRLPLVLAQLLGAVDAILPVLNAAMMNGWKGPYFIFMFIFSAVSPRPPDFTLMERFDAFDCLCDLFTCFNAPAL